MYSYRGGEPIPLDHPKPDTATLRAWRDYELKNRLAREEYARIGPWIDARYGPRAGRRHVPGAFVTRGNVVSLPQRARATPSLGQVSSLGWSA